MLKALELAGFKSFADKTRFEFHEGVTVVVGPNGSGKSNVVDAIKWVLGSQSAKSLRGSEMTDVIFNGSGSRAALNSAEVSLVLDNTGGMYGGESHGREVTITRRVYRSGEGEYLINGAACRLRDIRDLLAGTGIGTEAYSIIEQGKVDALLQASPRDRRAIFEEAAGISRFRSKRQDAARRLARVEQNLLRLSDIVDEVESRLRSVRMQAGKAQRYREGVKRLKELRTAIGIADWLQLTRRIDNVAGELDVCSQEDTSRRDWIEAAERQLPELDQAAAEAQAECEQTERTIAQHREQLASCQAMMSGLDSRQEDIEANLESLDQQWQAAQRTPAAEVSDSQSVVARLEAARGEFDSISRQLAEAAELHQEHATLVGRLTTQLDELRKRLESVRNRHQLTQEKLAAFDDRGRTLTAQLEEVEQELPALEQQRGGCDAEAESLQNELQDAERRVTAAEEHLETGRQQLTKLQQQATANRHEAHQAELEVTTTRHRIELVGELDREQSRNRQQEREFVAGQLGLRPVTVADVLHVDVDSAAIVEAALGLLTDYVIVPSTEQVLQKASELPAGCRLLRLDCPATLAAIDRLDLSGEAGVWGRADQFVDSQPTYQPLVSRLLGRTWVVDSLATAHRLARTAGQGLSFVTAEGDLLGADGTLVSGRRDQSRSALNRGQNLDQLRGRLVELEPVAQALVDRQQQLEVSLKEAERQVTAAIETARVAMQRASELRSTSASAHSRRDSARSKLHDAEARLRKLREERESFTHEQHASRSTCQTLDEQRKQLEATCAKLDQRREHASTALSEAAERKSTLEIEAAKLAHQIEFLEGSAATSAAAERTDIRHELDRQRQALGDRLADIERQRLANTSRAAELTAALEQLAPQKVERQAKRMDIAERREAVRQRLQAARRHIDDAQARRSQLEVTLAKLEHQRESLVDRLREDYQIDLPRVAANMPDERPPLDRKQVEKEINEIRDGLHRIGAVNVDALEELDEIEARFEAISAQYNDLSEAKASLEKLMAKLNTESRQMFLSTVETVRGHFQELYRRLFGGGEADILLEEYESDDALDCGVEIRASPPGKDTRTISLLSGGEKTMTCVALLLAMFRSKPSPFCVLDEVDAALDEANIGRFTSVLSDFLSSTQFVVITHSKKTMTGADTLYGVTMQESGISKQVSVRFDDVTEDGFIKPSAMRGDGDPPLAKAA